MLLDNKLNLIKYQGTMNFIAGLFLEETETEKKHYFGFMRTEAPSIVINNEGEHTFDFSGAQVTFLDRYQEIFEARGKIFGKGNKLFYLILIKPEEFDSMYRLLECIYND